MPGNAANATALQTPRWLAACAIAVALCAACAAPAPAGQTPPAMSSARVPPMSTSLPARRVREAPALDLSCRTAADCAVKNVGNCCGEMPACVNADSRVDPAAVQSQCAKDGRMGVCGFAPVSACACSAGRCEAADEGIGRIPRAPRPLPEPDR